MTKGFDKNKNGKPRTEKERASRHFNKPIEEVTEEDIENLPKRGSGRKK